VSLCYPVGMTDWIGSLRLAERSAHRVVLSISRATRMWGWLLFAIGVALLLPSWSISPWVAAVPGAMALFGLALATLERTLVFDQEAGVLSLDQRTLGISTRVEVPLFHLRAVVVTAHGSGSKPGKYVAFVDRRVGEPIFLDEARRIARLMKMAEAIAEVAEVRLEYNATGADL